MDRKEFFDTYAPYAQAEQMRYGIPASITLAQMWLESGGGSSYLAREGNNFFGIKAKGNWKGDVLYANDDKKHEAFRKYDNVHDSIRNHSMFLLGNRYQKQCGHLAVTDYKGWAQGIKAAGYATDPQYASKLIDVIEKNHLNDYDRNAVTVSSNKCGENKSHYLLQDMAKEGNVAFGMPLRNSDTLTMNSDFGPRKINYGSKVHEGIDLQAAKGTDVYASESGIVLTTGYQDTTGKGKAGGGNYIYVAYPRSDGSYRVASYMHLDSIHVKAGDRVNADTILAKSGNTGNVNEHLHFGVAKVSKADDVKALDAYIAKLSAPEQKADWSTVRNAVLGDNAGDKVGHFYDAKEYLAEIAVAGGLNTKLEKKGDSKKEDLLASAKEKISKEDITLLAQKGTADNPETMEHDISGSMNLGSSFFGDNDGQDNGQMNLMQQAFSGGTDLIGTLFSLAVAMFLSASKGKSKEEKQAAISSIEKDFKGESQDESSCIVDRTIPDEKREAFHQFGESLREKGSVMFYMKNEAIEEQERQQERNQDNSIGLV